MKMKKIKTKDNRIIYLRLSEIECLDIMVVEENIPVEDIEKDKIEKVDFFQVSIITKSGHFLVDDNLYTELKDIEKEYGIIESGK